MASSCFNYSGTSPPSLPSKTTDVYWLFAENRTNVNNEMPTNCGKWLVFRKVNEMDETWEIIKKATEEGKLGHASKVSTMKDNPLAGI